MARERLNHLLTQHRVAALATINQGRPRVSLVPFAWTGDAAACLIHVSDLAQHTRDLLAEPRVSLLLAQADDDPDRNPQTLARVTCDGLARQITRDEAGFQPARSTYLSRHPAAAVTFQLGDFRLFRIDLAQARYVAGLAQTYDLGGSELAELLGV